MTREEQIEKEATIYTDKISNYAEWSDDGGWLETKLETNDIKLIEKAFKEGAEWADETMIKKVITWLKENIDLVAENAVSLKSGYQEIVMVDNFEQKFREAMEE